MSRRSNTELNRSRAAAFIFGAAAIVLAVPVASTYSEWQQALRYGWPGTYTSEIAEFNAGESIWKAQVAGGLSLLVLTGAAIAAGFAARAAGQRVWLVVVVGLGVTVAALGVMAVLLTTPPAAWTGAVLGASRPTLE